MKEFFNKLTPAERRLVVFVGIGVFVVINIWWIIPKLRWYTATVITSMKKGV